MKRIFLCFAFAIITAAAITCVSAAAGLENNDRCKLVPAPGPCKGLFSNYFYNDKTEKCEEFFYGGCEGVVPFERIEDCQNACENAESFSVSFKKLANDLPYSGFEVEYPKSWEKQIFIVKINGREIQALWTGGGFDTAKQYASFILAPGDTGKKDIVVVAKGRDKEASVSIDWKPAPFIEIMNHFGNKESLFAKSKIEIYALAAKTVEFSFNSKAITATPRLAADGMGTIFTLDPAWVEGKNTLDINATDKADKSIAKQYSFMLITSGTIRKGDAFNFVYGYPGSKSGPFFYLNCEGAAISCKTDNEARQLKLNDKGWITFDTKTVANISAVEKGKAKLITSTKDHFTKETQKTGEIEISVMEAGQ